MWLFLFLLLFVGGIVVGFIQVLEWMGKETEGSDEVKIDDETFDRLKEAQYRMMADNFQGFKI